MEKKHFDPLQPGRQQEQESFERYSNPNPPSEVSPNDPQYDPQREDQTQPAPEVEPVSDDQETKSPLRPIDANKATEDWSATDEARHQSQPAGHQQPATPFQPTERSSGQGLNGPVMP